LGVFILVNLDNIPLAWSNFFVREGWFAGKACEQVVLSFNATAATYGLFKTLLAQPGARGVALDETKILLAKAPLPPPRPLLQPLQHRLPYHVINQYFENGTLPDEVPDPSPIDIVYAWVNSTSIEFSGLVKDRWEGEDLGRLNGEKRWRDNGELRGAVHSVVHAFKKDLRKVHIMSGDYPIDVVDTVGTDQWSMGQIPAWLDWSKVGKEANEDGPGLQWHFHREIFRLPREGSALRGWSDDFVQGDRDLSAMSDEEKEQEWQDLALPTFNSFAIETMLGSVAGCDENLYVLLSSDRILRKLTCSIYSNDDMFFLKDFTASDYHHPIFGNVIRSGFSNHLMAKPDFPESMISHDGEWGSLRHSSLLLHNRFNSPPQPYPDHIPKAMSIPLYDEANIIWSEEVSLSGTRGFRISKRGNGDVAAVPLVQWLRMERWREAFLWTWIVGKMGGVDGVWDVEEKEELKRILGIYENSDRVVVSRRERQTKDSMPKMLKKAGWNQPKQTWIAFSSFDGHVSSNPQKPADTCRFTLSNCLPAGYLTSNDTHSANDIFKHMTFAKRECGDCLITALVSASGESGLHAILPKEDAVYNPPEGAGNGIWDTTEPVLPLTKTWEEASFGLDDVIRVGSDVWPGEEEEESGTSVNLRKWCLKLLTRYNYAMGQ